MTEDLQNSNLACEYYGKSALHKDPEGLIAYAMVLYLQLVPEEQRSSGRSNEDFLLVIPAHLHDHMNYVHMWDLLEQAASAGYLCPFMIVRVEKVRTRSIITIFYCKNIHTHFCCICCYFVAIIHSIRIPYSGYPRLFLSCIVVIAVNTVCCKTNDVIISIALTTPVTVVINCWIARNAG